jgi:hypothetical protein
MSLFLGQFCSLLTRTKCWQATIFYIRIGWSELIILQQRMEWDEDPQMWRAPGVFLKLSAQTVKNKFKLTLLKSEDVDDADAVGTMPSSRMSVIVLAER